VDESLDLPELNQDEMKLWLLKNSIPDESTGCWNWKNRLDDGGYALINLKGTTSFAHRLSLVLYGGKKIGKLMAIHSCDNPRCVNPEHLSAGTSFDNMRDAASKGRLRRTGQKNGNYKHGRYCDGRH
jgi:hypothetical protein